MDARGPFTSLVMAVTVVKDVVVIICFALNLEFARVMFSKVKPKHCCLHHHVTSFKLSIFFCPSEV